MGFVMLDIIFYVEFYRSLFVILYFFFIPIVLCPSSIYSFDIYKFFLYLQISAINNFGNNTVQCFVGHYLFCCLFFLSSVLLRRTASDYSLVSSIFVLQCNAVF